MAITTTRGSVPAANRAPGWTVAAAQYGFTLWYAVCGYLALAHAADLTGHWHLPGRGEVATAVDADANWGFAIVAGTTLGLAPVLAGLALLMSGLLFLLDHTRGDRALTVSLLGAMAATVLTLVVSLTPAAQSLTGWLVD